MTANWNSQLQSFLGNALGRVEELERKVKEGGEAADKARAEIRRLRVERNEARAASHALRAELDRMEALMTPRRPYTYGEEEDMDGVGAEVVYIDWVGGPDYRQ